MCLPSHCNAVLILARRRAGFAGSVGYKEGTETFWNSRQSSPLQLDDSSQPTTSERP